MIRDSDLTKKQMPIEKMLLSLGLATIIFSCSKMDKQEMNSLTAANESPSGFISSSAAVENKKDSTRKFIRTAELKFKVKNVIESTYDIENITNRHGGFVTYTNLTSNIDNVTNTAISADSSLETTYYTVENSITVRVPNTQLDTVLKEISNNIDFLNHRIIKAEDVALQILSNRLTQKRSQKNEERITKAIDNRGKKLNETTVAEELLLSKQEQADQSKVSNLSLTDQINFSTINLSIYQREATKRELVYNDKNIDAYQPGFGSKITDALKYGWEMFETLILFLLKLWALFLLAIFASFIYLRYIRKFK